jgi:truncated hemoglobin YjbI
MEPQIYGIHAYADTTKELWDSLYQMYGQANNASRIFELQQNIANSKQEANQSFTEFFGVMKRQWEELRQLRPVASTVNEYLQREEHDRIFQLLANLSPAFEETKRDILLRTELPSLNSICSIIQGEETRKRVMSTNFKNTISAENSAHYVAPGNKSGDNRWTKGKMKKSKFFCDHCKKEGHSREHCYILHPHLRPARGRSTEAHVAVSDSHTDMQSQLNQLAQQV